MEMPRHPEAFREARALVDAYDGSAEGIVEEKLEQRLEAGDVDAALKLDQVRRGIERIYEVEGK